MSAKLRRGCTMCAAIIGAQALALGAWAQEPDTTSERERATQDRPAQDRGTQDRTGERTMDRSTDRTATDRSSASSTDRSMAGMKPVTPQTFASQAAVISKAEIELSQLALDKSKNQEVRDYAQRMVRDHTAADARLKKAAAAERINLPQSLDAEHQAKKQKLASLEGEAFDREYKKEMAMGHDKAVALFESASQAQQMPQELKQFAASTLPTLKDHKEQAHSMHEGDGG